MKFIRNDLSPILYNCNNKLNGSVDDTESFSNDDNSVEGTVVDIIPEHLKDPYEYEEVIVSEMPEINEARERDSKEDPPSGIIVTACGNDNDERRVCFYKNDCEILKKHDKTIYEGLDDNTVISVDIRWCGHYRPKKQFS